MKERLIWIDWAKALAVCCVVFCHLPQSQDWFYYRYLQADIITIFFFISGYLKKDHGSDKANWQKYWYSLILPYLFYNAIVYPYWLVKFYMLNGSMPDLFQAMRPIFGALFFEHKNAFCEPLNGPLWYLPAILFMHITIDLCRKTRYLHVIMISFCTLSVILYAANKYYFFAPNLTPMGILRRLPYYYMGFVFGQNQLHIALFYPSNIGFLFGILYGCKLLSYYKPKIIINLSIGTLVIIGLHIVLITVINYLLENNHQINGTICYQWYEALPVTIAIVGILYSIILWAKSHSTILLGRKSK